MNVNWKAFFLKNHTQNVMEKLVPVPFLKNQNWPYFWINSLKFYTVCFSCMASWELSKYVEAKLQTTCWRPHIKLFLKIKRGLELVSLPYFLHNIKQYKIFWRKISLLLYSINWPNSLSDYLYFMRHWIICVLQLFVKQGLTSWILKLSLAF